MGLHPALTLVAGERRLPLYRHTPVRSRSETERCSCFALEDGLYANLTRFVSFGSLGLSTRIAMSA